MLGLKVKFFVFVTLNATQKEAKQQKSFLKLFVSFFLVKKLLGREWEEYILKKKEVKNRIVF